MMVFQNAIGQRALHFKGRLVLLILSGVVLIALLQVKIWVAEQDPAVPNQWLALRPGMTRAQITNAVSDPILYFRERYGEDAIRKELIGGGFAMLRITYDEDGKAAHARVSFLTYKHAVFKGPDPLF